MAAKRIWCDEHVLHLEPNCTCPVPFIAIYLTTLSAFGLDTVPRVKLVTPSRVTPWIPRVATEVYKLTIWRV
jgi:hypothetical protein